MMLEGSLKIPVANMRTIDHPDIYEQGALNFAAFHGIENTFKNVLAVGANINTLDWDELHMLQASVCGDSCQLVQLLSRQAKDINVMYTAYCKRYTVS